MSLLRTIRSIWPVIVLVVCVFGAASWSTVYHFATRPAISASALWEEDGQVILNGSLDIHVSGVLRTRDCEIRVDRFLYRHTGRVNAKGKPIMLWVPMEPAPTPPVPLDEVTEYILRLPLPRNVEPGPWQFQPIGRDFCGAVPALDVPSRPGPSATVMVLATPDGSAPGTGAVQPELLLPEGRLPSGTPRVTIPFR